MEWYDFLIIALIAGGYYFYRWAQDRVRRGKKARKKKKEELNKKEKAALEMLQEQGYKLQEVRPSAPVNINVDGKGRGFNHQAGFVVEKNRSSYLVTLKKEDTPSLNSVSQKKELLLDYLLFQPAGILLYDVEKKKFQEIYLSLDFKTGRERIIKDEHVRAALIVLIVAGSIYLLSAL